MSIRRLAFRILSRKSVQFQYLMYYYHLPTYYTACITHDLKPSPSGTPTVTLPFRMNGSHRPKRDHVRRSRLSFLATTRATYKPIPSIYSSPLQHTRTI